MNANLRRLFRPKTVAVIGGSWAKNVVDQCARMGFSGQIWPVNPKRDMMGDHKCFASLDELPGTPDAVFLAVNRHQAVDNVRQLANMGAGGVVCFASGFKETGDDEGAALQDALISAAGSMPVLGPNCYGFVNGLDQTPIWPDVHGMEKVDRGVAIISQSSNIAINLTMQQRGLPVAYTMTAGNGAMVGLHDLIRFAASQDEVTAIGLYVEGFGDAAEFHEACRFAKSMGKPIVALKAGASEGAQAITMSHTASLAGADDIASAFLEKRCAVGRVSSLDGLLEALKLLHFTGPLNSMGIASMSCSGGEASLMADAAEGTGVHFPAFDQGVVARVEEHCHPLVQVSNPFDYHTFDWGKYDALKGMYAGVMSGAQALNALVLDWPKDGTGDDAGWVTAAQAWAAAKAEIGANAVVLASMPENMPPTVLSMLAEKGMAPMQGLAAFMEAVRAAAISGRASGAAPVGVQQQSGSVTLLDEFGSKTMLRRQAPGLSFPTAIVTQSLEEALTFVEQHRGQIVMKACGDIAHKSELGGVILRPDHPEQAFQTLMPIAGSVLVETLAKPPVVEALIGVHRDPVVGLCLTFGMGGTLTELWHDSVTLPLPLGGDEFEKALKGLKMYKLMQGYRGGPAADMKAFVEAVVAVATFAVNNAERLVELDINPLMIHEVGQGATAVDAVLRMVQGTKT